MRAGTHSERLGATAFDSVPAMWHHRVRSTPDAEAMIFRRDGVWQSMRWRDADARVRRIADALLASGLKPEDRCVILAGTSVEWILADMGILCAGGATTTLYPASTPEECAYVLADSEATFLFCDADQLATIDGIRHELPLLRRVIVFGGSPGGAGTVSLAAFEAEGRDHALAFPDAYDAARKAVVPSRLATLMYTSGTTGEPKGVMLTHDAWVYEAEAIDALGFMNPADVQYLFLPLAHVFAKVMQVSFIRLGVPTVVDGSTDDLLPNLQQTRPTWLAAVPRVFEKAYNQIVREAKQRGAVAWRTFNWALGVGRRVSALRQQRKRLPPQLALQYQLADRLVFQAVKRRFGGRIRFFVSGGAPLSEDIARFFHAMDLLVLEGYGLTESAAASCVNRLEDYRFGSVGPPLPGCAVRIAPDGEILIRSRGVMKGYHRRPADTAEMIDAEGWLHTGDLGVVLDGEHVKITGRKKDLIVTSGGKNIAPAHIEGLLKGACPYVSQVVMHGDRRPFCVALVALDKDAITRWALDRELSFADLADLASKSEVKALIQGYVERVNQRLPRFEQVRGVALLPEEPSRENGLLTATLKVKRLEVEERYLHLLDPFYVGSMATLV